MKTNAFFVLAASLITLFPMTSGAVVSGISCNSFMPPNDYRSVDFHFDNPKGNYLEAIANYVDLPVREKMGDVVVGVSLDQKLATDDVDVLFHFTKEDGTVSNQPASMRYAGQAFTAKVGSTELTCDVVELVGEAALAARSWQGSN